MIRKLRKMAKRGLFCFEYFLHSRRCPVILSAGMPRSGSTWLFNAARLLLRRRHGDSLSSGWIGDWRSLPKKPAMLLRIDEFDPFPVKRAKVILYSYRDLREALASYKRKSTMQPTLALARQWLDHDQHWRSLADFTLRYETMLDDPAAALSDLAHVLEVKDAPVEDLIRELSGLHSRVGARRESSHAEILLHPGHMTDGRHMTWHAYLSGVLVRQVEEEFREWFVGNGYPLFVKDAYDRRSRAA
jgi:hypothetical protein